MTIYNIPNMTTGIDDAIVGTIAEVPVFTPMFLLFIFLAIGLGGSIKQWLRSGSADLPMWSTIASIVLLVVSLIMTLKEGMIDGKVLGIVVAITCASGFWFFFDRNKNEV